jgi:hypothetical protein
MAFCGPAALAVGLCFLLAGVNGQNPTQECPTSADFMAHESSCSGFYHCSNKVPIPQACQEGLVWHPDSMTCVWPEQCRTNPTCPCNSSEHYGRVYRGNCCEYYFICTAANVLVSANCTQGQVYNVQNKRCESGPCNESNKLCIRPSGSNNGPCNLEAVPNNICKFRLKNTTDAGSDCASTLYFNNSKCACMPSDGTCYSNQTSSNANKALDVNCPYSYGVFPNNTNAPPKAISAKLPTFSSYVEYTNCKFGNSRLVLSSTDSSQASIYLPHYSNNQLSPPFGTTLVFKAASTGSFNILNNRVNGSCNGSIDLSATYTGSTYNVILTITGVTRPGQVTQVQAQASIQASISAATSDYVAVSILFDGNAYIRLANMGSAGNNPNPQVVNSQPSGTIGDYILWLKCGFQLFFGFTGEVLRWTCYEGCGDLSKVVGAQ